MYVSRCIPYAKQVAAETQTVETAYCSTHKKNTGRNKRCPNRNLKREGREERNRDKSTSTKQDRRQHTRGIHILHARKERGGVVAPRRHNRITESATKKSREAKIISKKAFQETNRKGQDQRKNERKRNMEVEHGKRQVGEEKKDVRIKMEK